MLAASLQQQINQQLFDKLELAYFCVDASMTVIEASDKLSRYGYDEIIVGAKADECADFMIGLGPQIQLDLPMIESPSGIVVSVNLLPRDDILTVLISNASDQAEQRQLLQQKANENELLLERQQVLMTELERASTQLEHKNNQLEEASRLQTSFLSGVSHEFRTPLTSIIGYTSLVEQSLSSDETFSDEVNKSQAEHLNAVQRSSKHLLSLVENLLDHGKIDSNEIVIRPKATNLSELFDDVILLLRPLSDAKQIELCSLLELGEQETVVIDDSRLRQCLINLIGNAIKFTDSGSVTINARLNDEVLAIDIVDTGPGISEEDLTKIRLPFWQAADTGKVGTGLGLTITERIIELMGSQLDISSRLGHGTQVSFSISAPVFNEDLSIKESTEALKHRGIRVLLVEDDIDIADLLVMMMTEHGLLVTAVDNGALAIDAMDHNDFDLVLMDIHMPVMTGYEALEKLQQMKSSTPVVIMSASAVENDRAKAEALGCYDYLTKPIDIEQVLAIVNNIVV